MTATPSETHEAALSDERLRELLPCPLFSEDTPHELRFDEQVSGRALRYVITCSCGVTFTGAYADAGSEVAPANAKRWTIAAWNRRTQPSAGEVVGWKLVPVERTEEMHKGAQSTTSALITRGHSADIWNAMLAAAPTPPDQSRVERLEAALRDIDNRATLPGGDNTPYRGQDKNLTDLRWIADRARQALNGVCQ